MKFSLWFLRLLILLSLLVIPLGAAIISGLSLYAGPQLPRIDSVLDLKLQTPLRVFSADGLLIGEFGEARRQPLKYDQLPPLFVKAVLAAEDDRFFSHGGIDASGLLRAASELAKSGRIQSGGSTITMQLARNFFLSTEKSFIRKFNEILLSIQLERTLTKEQIFELYANKIFLGHRAYGVQSAAFVYYGKGLNELSLAQWAMLAGLPKAPSKYNPLVNPERALIRRNWILDRMLKLGYITKDAHTIAYAEPETASFHGLKTDMDAPFIAEMARQFALEKLGEEAYTGGYNIHTTVHSRLQQVAQNAVWQGVLQYDRRHGYRGPEKRSGKTTDPDDLSLWADLLKSVDRVGDLDPAIVKSAGKQSLLAILKNGKTIKVEWTPVQGKQLRPYNNENYVGKTPDNFSTLFKPGDLIRVRQNAGRIWEIDQIPKIQAALVSIDSRTGAIIALSGGSDFSFSKFNRANQALRQPGSSFKPFIYLKALEKGYTPATLINDAPIVFQEAGMKEAWRPENAGDDYLGPTRMRRALYESRNMVSIRLLQAIGVKEFIGSLTRFGFDTSNMQPNLSLALGSHAFTPLTIASAYTVLSNGGFRLEPYIVQKITDSQGKLLYQHESPHICNECVSVDAQSAQYAPRVVDEQNAYIIDDMLKDVIKRGTGRPALVLDRPDIAGKTGTTNGPTDAWFAGYSPTITTVTWMGFDDNSLLGKKEYGGTAALPIWINFMQVALQDQPVIERVMPPGLTTMRIDPDTGQQASPERTDAIFEIFRSDITDPENTGNDPANNPDSEHIPATGTGINNTPADDLF